MIIFVVVFAIITIIQDSTIIVPSFSAPAHVVFPSTRHWRNWETPAERDGEDWTRLEWRRNVSVRYTLQSESIKRERKGLMNEQNLHWYWHLQIRGFALYSCRFETIFPLELEGRIQPSELSSFLNAINTKLAEAYAMTPNITDNLIAVATLWTSLLWKTSHFEKKLREVEKMIGDANKEMFNKAGLNVLSPRDVALQFVSLVFFCLFCFVYRLSGTSCWWKLSWPLQLEIEWVEHFDFFLQVVPPRFNVHNRYY